MIKNYLQLILQNVHDFVLICLPLTIYYSTAKSFYLHSFLILYQTYIMTNYIGQKKSETLHPRKIH